MPALPSLGKLAVALAAALIIGGSSAGSAGAHSISSDFTIAANKSVKTGDDYFGRRGRKPKVTIRRGTRVTWRWVGRRPHNVVLRSGPGRKFASRVQTRGRYTRKFTRRGTYRILCTIHPRSMQMTIKVR